jgi:long-subunit acyl-CoA synthetase (AMP-forming)
MITDGDHIQIIDRVKQSRGEYIAMIALNDRYAEADIANLVSVNTHARYDHHIAVVFPKKRQLDEWSQKGRNLHIDPAIHQEMQDSLDSKFRGFERTWVFLIEPTVEKGLITLSVKP